MSSVLLTVMNGSKVIDSGSGVVICFDAQSNKTFVLTCAHNLKAFARRVAASPNDKVRIAVNGVQADDIGDATLAKFDLAILSVAGNLGTVAAVKSLSSRPESVKCDGFAGFFQHEFARRTVTSAISGEVNTLLADGTAQAYLEMTPKRSSPSFVKGLSGAPVYDDGVVIGIARMLDRSDDGQPKPARGQKRIPHSRGYAIRLSPALLSLIQEFVPCAIGGLTSREEPPPQAAPPRAESVAKNDIQKRRWGGRAENHNRRLTITNVREYGAYFVFDAVVESLDPSAPLKPPFVFHLHDSYPKSTIWVRKTDGVSAVLADIEAVGTYTLGVQLKDSAQNWRSLEYDLASYKRGRLHKLYD